MIEEFRRWQLRRRIARKLKGINWEECKRWNNGWYRQSGEFQALEWLKSYSEGLASAEPLELLTAILSNGKGLDRKDQLFAATILRYMK
jgi:hypothetical protein